MEFNVKKSINLTGVTCPMNFVKTKAALAAIDKNDLLEVILDEGDAILNVPRSVKDEGHQVIKVESLGTTYKVIIKKC